MIRLHRLYHRLGAGFAGPALLTLAAIGLACALLQRIADANAALAR